MLKFSFSGADGVMAVPETLTSGMIGKEVCFSFSEEWKGLSKVAVFSSGKIKRDVVLNDSVILIPPEVLETPMRYLYVGVYGVSGDGTLVIPTIRVKGPFIEAGTDPSGAPGTEPTLAVWAQMLSAVGNLMDLKTENKDSLVAAVNELAVQAEALESIGELDELSTDAKDTLVAAINELAAKTETGLTETEKTLILTLFRNIAYTSDMSGTIDQLEALWSGGEEEDTHIHSYTATLTPPATCTTAGQRTYICTCGDSYTETIPALGHHYVDGICSVCGAKDPDYGEEVTMIGITAAYSGGNVAVGTSVTDLTGIVVTASYSDGSTAAVTGYTLSGTISEGSNLITVSYGGMTATFTVTGVSEETVVKGELLYNWDLTSSLTDTVGGVTASLGGSSVQDENGLTISGANGSCYFGGDMFSAGRSFEVDVASADFKNSGTNGFFIMILTNAVNGKGEAGLTYRNNNQWCVYAGGSWHTPDTAITDGNAITGKTIRFVSESAKVFSVYFGDVKLDTVTLSANHTCNLQIGSNSTAFYNLVITAVRVYGEVA